MALYSLRYYAFFNHKNLPVIFDASARALRWLDTAEVIRPADYEKAKDALRWTALTYVVAALSSIAMSVYYIMPYTSKNRDYE